MVKNYKNGGLQRKKRNSKSYKIKQKHVNYAIKLLNKNKEIKTYIKETNNYLLYSVPYKPKTNAIESFFSQCKHYFVIENTAIT